VSAKTVQKFTSETAAVSQALKWSRERRSEFTVIHGPSEGGGLVFFVEEGDGGMVRSTERVVGRYFGGRAVPA
jgi:hypothetical protein